MLIGIIIGFVLHEVFEYFKEFIGLRMRVKLMKAGGKTVLVDYVNMRILDVNDSNKGEAYKRANIGFTCSKDES